MASFDFNQGHTFAISMVQDVARCTADEIRGVLDNLEAGAKRKPPEHAAGIMAVVDLARRAIEKRGKA